MTGDRRTIAIIGAGIVGVSTALWLLRAGNDVVLIDRTGPAEGASFGNGGVLAASGFVPATGPGLPAALPRMLMSRDAPLFLRWRHLPRALPWLLRYLSYCSASQTTRIARAMAALTEGSYDEHRALSDGTEAARYLFASDYLHVFPDRAAFEAERAEWDLCRAAGYTWTEMDRAALKAYDPAFSSATGFAVALPGHGYVSDPAAYVRALARHAENAGLRLLRADATAIVTEGGEIRGVRAGGEVVACDAAVIAAGAWSASLCRQLGLRVPLESERGYHLDLWEPSITLRAPTMVSGGQFVMTPMEGRLRLAGALEIGGLTAGPSDAPVALLRRLARAALPGLRWSHETSWLGHRPGIPDSLPVIGEVPGAQGVWTAFGHHHLGLTSGPRTGKLLARMIAGGRQNTDMAPYAPARFSRSA
ncbi:NAD(P)/FAD-dependent oxidoreductase [Citreimonas salinaria]|uniref:D-amino-acid dehydrogenase n=1 Tax=Citreimonas salinaria TaxID=321339 RepID=A0A1H3JXR0_9RHOB|nr:FAD-dependent oxidoreductase [Citreimonas salinaria]SDY44054.1 D-amino-acid dehydrogenase [Citreimonas salinaria]